MDKELTTNQSNFIVNLMNSNSISEASKKTGVAKSTGYGYMRMDHVIREYERLKRDKFKRSTDRIVNLVDNGVEVMDEIMNDENETGATRVSAVKTVWANAFKSYEMQEVEERLERIESLLEDDNQ